MNSPLKFLTARKILPLLDLLAKFKRVLACLCSPNLCVTRKLAKQIFYFCSCSQKNCSARHACECSQRPFITPKIAQDIVKLSITLFFCSCLQLLKFGHAQEAEIFLRHLLGLKVALHRQLLPSAFTPFCYFCSFPVLCDFYFSWY